MPPFPQLSPEDIHNIGQYLKLQVELTANRGTYRQTYANLQGKMLGDAAKGAVFFQAQCVRCHSATADLAKVGAKYPQATQMQAKILWPAPQGPARATVTTASGQAVTGAVRHIDDFGVSLIDSDGEYRYWPASEVKVEIEDKLAGHRTLLAKYTDADIHNLTAYLVTLK